MESTVRKVHSGTLTQHQSMRRTGKPQRMREMRRPGGPRRNGDNGWQSTSQMALYEEAARAKAIISLAMTPHVKGLQQVTIAKETQFMIFTSLTLTRYR